MNRRTIAIIVIILLVIGTGLSFFRYTSTKANPTAMKLFLPKGADADPDPAETNIVDPAGAITLILLQNDLIYFYEGNNYKDGKLTDFYSVRTLILEKKKSTDIKKFVVIIKPTDKSTYKNSVDALDEMAINDVKRYAMVEISDDEQLFVDALKK
ncbi:MAG TPA: biopolymer transporter ExbD [Chitinophagaceae bacterium]